MYCEKKVLWIELVDIIPKEGNKELLNAKGAYTNVIMYASSKNSFIRAVNIEFSHQGYYIIEIDDVEPFSERVNKYLLRNDLLELAKSVEQTGNIGIDRFHSYKIDETLN